MRQAPDPVVEFGREVCGEPALAEQREWLVTNGLGSVACGTIGGAPTRSYHGFLVAALQPPVDRTLLVAPLRERALLEGRDHPLTELHTESFHLEGTIPCWTFALADLRLEKRIFMPAGVQASYAHYRLVRGEAPLRLEIEVPVQHRSHHGGPRPRLRSEAVASGVRIHPHTGGSFQVLSSGGRWWVPSTPRWREDIHLAREAERGLACRDAHLEAARVQIELSPERPCLTLVATTAAAVRLDGEKVLAERIDTERRLLERWRRARPEVAAAAPPWIRQLVLAADQFLVQRSLAGETPASGRSVIAGYPWFDDWGRDTMIALPGLTLATGRGEEAVAILRTYAAHLDRGMLPNRFPGGGGLPDPRHGYNTVDAALWFFQAVRAVVLEDDHDDVLRELYPRLAGIVEHHRDGSRCGIGMDPRDGLLRAGEADSQLTWMDARHDGRSVTPRIGKPVEVNALWHSALAAMAEFAARLGEDPAPFRAMAARTRRGFARFWCEERGHCFDVLDVPGGGGDASLRPNQLLALSLPHRLLPPPLERSLLRHCAQRLLTSHGLRSLDPRDPRYQGRYGGNRSERDEAYHQGTAWAWWLGPFALAHGRIHGDPEGALSFLEPIAHHLRAAGLGSVSEIFDGDAPHAPRGCIAQAWSVAEVLRAWTELRRLQAGG